MKKLKKIALVNYEQGMGIEQGILTKFAVKMKEELDKLGYEVEIVANPSDTADVNHHINFIPYKQGSGINSLMVTHFLSTEGYKKELLVKQLETADVGICFSKETMDMLNMPKLDYVLPAHDGLPRRPLVIAILTKTYADGRKREWMVPELAKTLDKDKFAFRIMGNGWRKIVEELIADGWKNIEYFEDFDYGIHKAILDSSDYLLYTGNEDEGAMSVLDATQAGLKTIAPPVGFHKDIGIDYPFITQGDLNEIFRGLSINKVEDWTWANYVKSHIKIWESCVKSV